MSRTLKDRPIGIIEADPNVKPDRYDNVYGVESELYHRTGYRGGMTKRHFVRQMNRKSRRECRLALRKGAETLALIQTETLTGKSQGIYAMNGWL